MILTRQSLTDEELCLLCEVDALDACDYREEEIAEMLGKKWPQAQAIMLGYKNESARRRA